MGLHCNKQNKFQVTNVCTNCCIVPCTSYMAKRLMKKELNRLCLPPTLTSCTNVECRPFVWSGWTLSSSFIHFHQCLGLADVCSMTRSGFKLGKMPYNLRNGILEWQHLKEWLEFELSHTTRNFYIAQNAEKNYNSFKLGLTLN